MNVNGNTSMGAQLIGAFCSTAVLCDMLYLKWDKCGNNVARPPQRCGTCVRFGAPDGGGIRLGGAS